MGCLSAVLTSAMSMWKQQWLRQLVSWHKSAQGVGLTPWSCILLSLHGGQASPLPWEYPCSSSGSCQLDETSTPGCLSSLANALTRVGWWTPGKPGIMVLLQTKPAIVFLEHHFYLKGWLTKCSIWTVVLKTKSEPVARKDNGEHLWLMIKFKFSLWKSRFWSDHRYHKEFNSFLVF